MSAGLRISTLAAALGGLLAAIAFAGAKAELYEPAPPYDPSADWCLPDVPYSNSKDTYLPDGAITQTGPYFFRVCQGGSKGSTPERRVMRFFYNPARVERLSSDHAMIGGMMINALAGWDRNLRLLLDRHVLVGEHQIGPATYQVYRYVF
ncbi:MAG: hypothetical protein AAGH90_13205 [Pseudomonadota bacterium]